LLTLSDSFCLFVSFYKSETMIGEHLWLGNIGKFLLLLSFFMALFSGVVYSISTRLKPQDDVLRFQKAGKLGFLVHAGTMIFACLILCFLIFNHYFEYAYVWKYSSVQMPLRYTIACFWAGQEGSFMLWGFWQALLGIVVLISIRKKDPRVMAVIAFAQAALLTVLLGIDLGFYKLGSSPFTLLRDLPDSIGNAFFKNPAYLSNIIDGMGLNPLLENYWMISHPPILFLGYASAMIPFALALASLWKGDYSEWLKSGINWTLWSIFTLAFGIIIGGAWAYKSLTFGGFWAWDPVENASLVPLLLLIAGMHFLIIAHKRHHSFGLAYGFVLSSYVMVWYASYLTRSGVLGQTSVHAFGDNGMSALLVVITILFLIAGAYFFALRYKKFPSKEGSETVWTKDFLMLIGSLVLALSAFQITITTSIPIWNKLFGLHIAPPLEPIKFYNNWQIVFTVIVLFLVAGVQYISFRKHQTKSIVNQFAASFIFSVIATILLVVLTAYHEPNIIVLFFAVLLAVTTSITALINYKERRVTPGSIITHLGFAFFILGALLAFSNSQVISNVSKDAKRGIQSEQQEGSVMLFRGKTVKLTQYYAVYNNRLPNGAETAYQIDFYRDANGKEKLFSLFPTIKQNEKMGAVFNPSTRNFIEKDVYTYISHAELVGSDNSIEGNNLVPNDKNIPTVSINMLNYRLISKQNIALKQKLSFGTYQISLDSIWLNIKDKAYKDVDIMARLNVVHPFLGSQKIVCAFMKRGDQYYNQDAINQSMGLAFRFEMTSDKTNNIELGVYEQKLDFIVLKAIIFPWMNVLWLGALLVLSGLILSLYKRTVPMRV
jgi:cytochrome c-type biogenesis protein CcmF